MLPALATIGLLEVAVIVLVVVVLFGATKIPKLMRGIGSGVHEFKEGLKEGEKKPDDKPASEAEKK